MQGTVLFYAHRPLDCAHLISFTQLGIFQVGPRRNTSIECPGMRIGSTSRRGDREEHRRETKSEGDHRQRKTETWDLLYVNTTGYFCWVGEIFQCIHPCGQSLIHQAKHFWFTLEAGLQRWRQYPSHEACGVVVMWDKKQDPGENWVGYLCNPSSRLYGKESLIQISSNHVLSDSNMRFVRVLFYF